MDWLDAARYADTNGYQNDFARTMWPWRDWVIDAFNRNLPFDRFVDRADRRRPAAGRHAGAEDRHRLQPQQPHRHRGRLDRRGVADRERRRPRRDHGDRLPRPDDGLRPLPRPQVRPDHADGVLPVLRLLQQRQREGRLHRDARQRAAAGRRCPSPRTSGPRSRGGFDLAIAVGDQRTLTATKEAADEARKEKAEFEKRIPSVMVMEDLPKPRPTFVLKRGRYDMPDKSRKVEPGVPACLPSLPAGCAPRTAWAWRAGWSRPRTRSTARVAVNRLWQHHFGTGLVKTAENFGIQGEPPSHPELLDWLATEFIRTGWDVKAHAPADRHQRDVSPVVAGRRRRSAAHDPENRLLARGPRFRLPAEVVRDNALAIAGLLSTRIGGPSVKPYQPAGLWEELAGGAGEGPYIQDKGPNLYRRSLYVYRKRTVPHPAMATFDAPSREICQVKRGRGPTRRSGARAAQRVTYVEAARRLAKLMIAEGGCTPEDRIALRFRRRSPGRRPRPSGRLASRAGTLPLDGQSAIPRRPPNWSEHGESSPIRHVDPAELAAYTATAASSSTWTRPSPRISRPVDAA